MPVSFDGFDLNRGLQAGQQLYGEGPRSGLGMAVKSITDRAKQLNDLGLKSKFEVATEREKSKYTSMVPQYSFDPSTGKFSAESMMPKGSIVRNKQTPLESEMNRQNQLSMARSSGKKATEYADLITQFGFIENDMNSVLKSLDNIPEGRMNEAKRLFRKATGEPGSEDIFLYEGNRDLILSKIAKTFGGDVGVLTEGDIARIRAAFPATWMNIRERQAKIDWIKEYVRSRIESYQSRYNTMSQSGGSNPFLRPPAQDELDDDIDSVLSRRGASQE